MDEKDPLTDRIELELRRAEQRIQDFRQQAQERQHGLEKRHERYRAIADRVIQELIMPRMQRLPTFFDNAQVNRVDGAAGFHCTCSLAHTPRFPATTTLDMGVTHDDELHNVLVLYDLDIIPVYMQFDRRDQLSQPLDAFDFDRVAPWIDDKIVDFVRTYLRLEFVDQYQQDNLVTDPVACERFPKPYAIGQVEHGGKVYFFLSEENLQRFRADPTHYVQGRCGGG